MAMQLDAEEEVDDLDFASRCALSSWLWSQAADLKLTSKGFAVGVRLWLGLKAVALYILTTVWKCDWESSVMPRQERTPVPGTASTSTKCVPNHSAVKCCDAD